jgi:antitoxin MazE
VESKRCGFQTRLSSKIDFRIIVCHSVFQKYRKEEIMLLSVKKKYTLTIPKSIREKLHVKEGEYVQAEIKGESLVLTPVKVIKKSQEYFWTGEWQEGENEADEDIKSGRLSRAYGKNELDTFFKELRREARKSEAKKD